MSAEPLSPLAHRNCFETLLDRLHLPSSPKSVYENGRFTVLVVLELITQPSCSFKALKETLALTCAVASFFLKVMEGTKDPSMITFMGRLQVFQSKVKCIMDWVAAFKFVDQVVYFVRGDYKPENGGTKLQAFGNAVGLCGNVIKAVLIAEKYGLIDLEGVMEFMGRQPVVGEVLKVITLKDIGDGCTVVSLIIDSVDKVLIYRLLQVNKKALEREFTAFDTPNARRIPKKYEGKNGVDISLDVFSNGTKIGLIFLSRVPKSYPFIVCMFFNAAIGFVKVVRDAKYEVGRILKEEERARHPEREVKTEIKSVKVGEFVASNLPPPRSFYQTHYPRVLQAYQPV